MKGKTFGILCLAAMAAGAINHNPNDPAWQKHEQQPVAEQAAQ